MDRSMSLPLSVISPQSYNGLESIDSFSLANDRSADSFSLIGSNNHSILNSNSSLLSPLRKMDFALCKNFLFKLILSSHSLINII